MYLYISKKNNERVVGEKKRQMKKSENQSSADIIRTVRLFQHCMILFT